MVNITLSLPDGVKKEMENYEEVKWSEVAKKAIIEKLKQMRKLEILRKYVDKESFSAADKEWMDENDWHPVDEREMKESFVQETVSALKSKSRKMSINDLLK